jgi:hypothetical protein
MLDIILEFQANLKQQQLVPAAETEDGEKGYLPVPQAKFHF